jgi:SSS family solute:Na+ symporter
MEDLNSVVLELNHSTVYAFVGYLLIVIGLGVYSARFSSAGVANYFIGGRKMGMFVVAVSAVVSGRSAWLLLGFTGMSFAMGLSAIWAVLGYIIVEFFLFFFYAPRIRRFTGKNDCITLPDFFSARFDDRRGILRIVTVSIIIVFMVAYVSAQFVAGGKAFSASFLVSETQGIFITATIILFYTIVGGFLAVSLTDTIQGVIMVFALIILPLIAISHLGGFSVFFQEASKLNDGSFFNPFALGLGTMVGFLGIGLGSPGTPHIIARYMSIGEGKSLRKVAYVGTLTNLLLALGALFTGLVGRIYFPDLALLPAADAENVYPALAQQHLNPILFGVVISSIFAAIMSTADSQLLVAASAVVRDIYEKIIKKQSEIPQQRLVIISRSVVFVLVLIALFLALAAGQLVFWLVLFAWAGLGAAFGPTSILAIFWKRTTLPGVIAGVITGATTVIVWSRISFLKNAMYELVPAFAFALLATIIVSLLTKQSKEAEQKFGDFEL